MLIYFRYADGSIRLLNKNLAGMQQDFIYHLGLDTAKYDLKAMFGDVKVCILFNYQLFSESLIVTRDLKNLVQDCLSNF